MEYRKRCKVCGTIFCYTDEDIKHNGTAALLSGISSIGAAAGAFSGNWGATRANQEQSYHAEAKIKDYNHCPKCHSADLILMTDDDWEDYQKEAEIKAGGISINANASEETLIKRIRLFIEDKDWAQASAYCSHVLDINPENGEIYYLLILINNKVRNDDELIEKQIDITKDPNYSKVCRFGSSGDINNLNAIVEGVRNAKEEQSKKEIDIKVTKALNNISSDDIEKVNDGLQSLQDLQGKTSMISSDVIAKATEKKAGLEKKNRKKTLVQVLIGAAVFAVILAVYLGIHAKNQEEYKNYALDKLLAQKFVGSDKQGELNVKVQLILFHKEADLFLDCYYITPYSDHSNASTDRKSVPYTIEPRSKTSGVIKLGPFEGGKYDSLEYYLNEDGSGHLYGDISTYLFHGTLYGV